MLKNMSPFIFLGLLLFAGFTSWSIEHLKRSEKMVRTKASILEKGISMYLMLMTALYTFVLSNSMSAFRCFAQDDGSSTLVSSPNLNCYDHEWNLNLFAIAFGLLVLISVPCCVGWILFSYRKLELRRSNRFVWKYDFLVSPYRDRFFWWEFFVLMKKLFFVVFIDSTNNMSLYGRSFILLVFFAAEIALDWHIFPFHFENKSLLQVKTW